MQTMTMIFLGFVIGTLVGLMHFGGLAWTVRRMVDGQHPGVVALSFVLRMLATAAVMVAVAVVAPFAALGLIPGVIAARVILTQQARRGVSRQAGSNRLSQTHIDRIGDG